MPLYDFPIWAGDPANFPTDGFRGAGWRLLAANDPYANFGTKAWERHFFAMRRKYPNYSVHSITNGKVTWIAPQIVAEAKSRLTAQRVFQLLISAMSILDGNNLFEFDDGIVVPRNRRQLEDLSPDDLRGPGHTISRQNVGFGCRLAAALSRRKSFMYAAFKLTLSYRIASVHWMELHPRYYPKNFGVSDFLFDHVRMASAITLAYSAIEELQLEPRPKVTDLSKLKLVGTQGRSKPYWADWTQRVSTLPKPLVGRGAVAKLGFTSPSVQPLE